MNAASHDTEGSGYFWAGAAGADFESAEKYPIRARASAASASATGANSLGTMLRTYGRMAARAPNTVVFQLIKGVSYRLEDLRLGRADPARCFSRDPNLPARAIFRDAATARL